MDLAALDNIAGLSALNLERFGEYQALVVGGAERGWTNRELHETSRRLAAAVAAELAIAPGDRVATLGPNSAELLITYQALFCIGAVVVPLLADLSPQEVGQRLGHCRARAIFGSADALRAAAPQLAALPSLDHVVTFDEQLVELAGARSTTLQALVDSAAQPASTIARTRDDLACIIYTGATTSAAKGVMQTHHNLWANVRNNAPLNRSLADLIALPMAHTFGMGIWLSKYVMGDKLVLVEGFDPEQIAQLIEQHRVERLVGVPTMLLTLLDHPAADRYDMSSVRDWGIGGAPMSDAQIERFLARFPGRLEKAYGLTEACPTIARQRGQLPQKPGSCGRALPGVEVRIVDPTDRGELPVGEVGEICARGDNISPGYFEMPEETARVFRDGWLYTGDLGRLDEDGDLYIVGREKEMILQAGFNVYPVEVEAALAKHPAVAEAAVIGVADELVGEAVVAFVTGTNDEDGRALSEQSVIAHCDGLLAAYKIPLRVAVLDGFPRTAVGKTDKRALRVLASQTDASSEKKPELDLHGLPSERRQELIERRLGDAFARVLGLQSVAAEDNFFELGGRSLQVTQLVGWVREALGAKIAMRTFFEMATPRALAARIDEALQSSQSSEQSSSVGAAPRVDGLAAKYPRSQLDDADLVALLGRFGGPDVVADIFRTTAAQADALAPLLDSEGQVDGDVLRPRLLRMELWIDGPLDRSIIGRIWRAMVERHDALRTVLTCAGLPHAVQVTLRPRAVEPLYSELDVSDLERDEQLARVAQLQARCRADSPPWVDVYLVKLGETDHRFVLLYQIGAVDGISLSELRQELMIEYAARVAGNEPALPTRRQPTDFVGWLVQQDSAEAESFWRAHGAADKRWAKLQATDEHADVRFDIGAAGCRALQELARELHLPLSVVLLGAWALSFGVRRERHRVLVGCMDSGRSSGVTGAEAIIGSFSHRVPVDVDISADIDIDDWLRALQLQLADIQAYEHALTEQRMRDWWGGPAGHLPFDLGINIQYLRRVEHQLASRLPMAMDPLDSMTLRNADGWAVVPLNVSIWLHEGNETTMTGTFAYDVAQFSAGVVEDLGRGLVVALEAFLGCETLAEAREEVGGANTR